MMQKTLAFIPKWSHRNSHKPSLGWSKDGSEMDCFRLSAGLIRVEMRQKKMIATAEVRFESVRVSTWNELVKHSLLQIWCGKPRLLSHVQLDNSNHRWFTVLSQWFKIVVTCFGYTSPIITVSSGIKLPLISCLLINVEINHQIFFHFLLTTVHASELCTQKIEPKSAVPPSINAP